MNKTRKHKAIFPLFHNFKATTFIKAFILNAIAVSLITTSSIQTREYLDDIGRKEKGGWNLSNFTKSVIVLFVSFICSLFVYLLLFLITGFGGGMLAN